MNAQEISEAEKDVAYAEREVAWAEKHLASATSAGERYVASQAVGRALATLRDAKEALRQARNEAGR